MKVHKVEKARKAIKSAGVGIGDSYYWWKFMRGPKCVSKTYPKPQQLTRSEFAIGVMDLSDRLYELKAESYIGDPQSLKSDLEDIASDIRQLGEEQDEKFSNMPEGLQQGDTGQLLEERRDGCESWADEIEGIEVDVPDRESANGEAISDEEYEKQLLDAIQNAIDEAQQASAP